MKERCFLQLQELLMVILRLIKVLGRSIEIRKDGMNRGRSGRKKQQRKKKSFPHFPTPYGEGKKKTDCLR